MENSQLLSQLNDIQLPSPISQWPMTIAWLLIIAAFITALFYGYYLWQKQRRAMRFKHEALKQWHMLRALQNEPHAYLQAINQLLKQTALTAGYKYASNLSGKAWLDFLERQSDSLEFNNPAGQLLADGIYRQDINEEHLATLHTLIGDWLKQCKARKGAKLC